MTQYLLDTDTFIFLLKHDPSVETKALAVGMSAIATSVVTAAEVLHGAYFSADPTASLLMTHNLIGQVAVLDLTPTMADKFGEIKADLRRNGLGIADFDLLIGATAIVAGRTLITNNTRHFARLSAHGLLLENWKS